MQPPNKPQMAKKNFKASVGGLVDNASSTSVQLSAVEGKLLEGIPIAGDDLLNDLLASTSDRTVEPAPLALPEANAGAQTAGAPEVDPNDFGDEVPIDPRQIEAANQTLKSGRGLDAVEDLVRQVAAAPGEGAESSILDAHVAPEPFTSLDAELNRIAAEELVEWYDVLQSVLSVWAYEHFSSPKTASETVERLYPKIANAQATATEKALFEQAQSTVLGFTKRKTSFAESVAMSQGLKARTVRLLDRILETRQVRISPELLLGFLLLTPIIVNGGRIMLEKLGFANADNVLEKFTTFVGKQEAEYWKDQPNTL